MTDYEHLCRAIAADPDADGPRLALADWLQENAGTVRCGYCQGHHVELGCRRCVSGWAPDGRLDRAAFIIGSLTGRPREQLSAGTGPAKPTDWYDRGQAAGFDGFAMHGFALYGWSDTADPLVSSGRYVEDAGVRPHRINRDNTFSAAFRRGMACAVSLSLPAFVKYHKRLFALHPIVEVVLSCLNVVPVSGTGCIVMPDVSGCSGFLPYAIYDHLAGGESRYGGLYYRSGPATRHAVSRACVAFARADLGLPPLAPAWLDKNAPLFLDEM